MIIGVLHLLPTDDPDFLDHAVRNAKKLEEAGVDAIIVENFYDARVQMSGLLLSMRCQLCRMKKEGVVVGTF
jgi:predicted TIM-barrel enzyme